MPAAILLLPPKTRCARTRKTPSGIWSAAPRSAACTPAIQHPGCQRLKEPSFSCLCRDLCSTVGKNVDNLWVTGHHRHDDNSLLYRSINSFVSLCMVFVTKFEQKRSNRNL